MLDAVLKNLIDIGWAMLIFLAAYLANVAFSLYYNIRILLQPFDKNKAINSALKVAAFVVGLTLLCVSITTLPLFAEQLGWAIPEEYTDIFADLVIVGASNRAEIWDQERWNRMCEEVTSDMIAQTMDELDF